MKRKFKVGDKVQYKRKEDQIDEVDDVDVELPYLLMSGMWVGEDELEPIHLSVESAPSKPPQKFGAMDKVMVADSGVAFEVANAEFVDGRWKYSDGRKSYWYSEDRLVEIVGPPAANAVPDATVSILEERGKNYGRFENQATIAQMLEAILRADFDLLSQALAVASKTRLAEHLRSQHTKRTPDQNESLKLITHKIARICNGNPDYSDSWRDIAGYAVLVADRLEGKVR